MALIARAAFSEGGGARGERGVSSWGGLVVGKRFVVVVVVVVGVG